MLPYSQYHFLKHSNFPQSKKNYGYDLMTPRIMVLRLAASPDIPLFQIIASFAILIVSLPFVIVLSAKIFRSGILIYGKQPTSREILKWLRYK